MKQADIHQELMLAFGKEVDTLTLVKDWIHEFKTDRQISTDEGLPGRLPTDYMDVRILK
jgi:hypothetical protein